MTKTLIDDLDFDGDFIESQAFAYLAIRSYLELPISFPETKGMDKADRLIKITKNLGYQKYFNLIGGKELYRKEYFKKKGIELKFVSSQKVDYNQLSDEFVPWLSIIDILMFNDKQAIKEQINAFNLI